MKIRYLILLATIHACSSSNDDKKAAPAPEPTATPTPKLGLEEFSNLHGTWALKDGDWTKVVHLPETSDGEGVVQVYHLSQLRSEAALDVDWLKESGTLTLTTKQVTVDVESRYICGKKEVWTILAYDPLKSIKLTTSAPRAIVPASCFGDDMALTENRELTYSRYESRDLAGATCAIPGSKAEVCGLPIDGNPICSDEFTKSISEDKGFDSVVGRWFQVEANGKTTRCRVLSESSASGPGPSSEPKAPDFTSTFQVVDRVVCKEQNTSKGIGGVFKRLAFAFDECEFDLTPKQREVVSLTNIKALNADSKWSATFKKLDGRDAYHVTLKRDTSLAQMSDYIPDADLQLELAVNDNSGKPIPLAMTIPKPVEADFYKVDLSLRTAHKRFVWQESDDRAHEVAVQGRKTADGMPVLRFEIFKSRDAGDRFVYHSIDPIVLDTTVKIADGFGLGSLRNQFTVIPAANADLAALVYEDFRTINGYAAILAWDEALRGTVPLSSDPLTTYMTSSSSRISEELATLDLSYLSGFGVSHAIRSNIFLTSRLLSDDLKLIEASPGSYTLKNEATYSLFPLRGSYLFKCGEKAESVTIQGRYFPSRTSLDWQNPGPRGAVLTFSISELTGNLETCAGGWKFEGIRISEAVPEEYPEREAATIPLPQ